MTGKINEKGKSFSLSIDYSKSTGDPNNLFISDPNKIEKIHGFPLNFNKALMLQEIYNPQNLF